MSTILPLDLPEIRDCLAKFLTRRELTICCRVSHAWRQSFEPLVWKELTIEQGKLKDDQHSIPVEVLQQHSRFIQSLVLRDRLETPYLSSLICPNLRRFKFLYGGEEEEDGQKKGKDSRSRVGVLEFVRQCRGSLRSLVITHGWNDPTPSLEAAWACPSLESLTLVGTGFSKSRDLGRYWEGLWSRLTCLCLREFDFCLLGPQDDDDDDEDDDSSSNNIHGSNVRRRMPPGASYFEKMKGGTLGRIKVLELIRVRGLEDDLLFLKLCPDLKTLVWCPVQNQRGLEHLTEQARQCPKLTNFCSDITSGNDDHTVARFIESRSISTAPLSTLALHARWLSETSWELLKGPSCSHHLLTLRVIELKGLFSMMDKIIQEILCSMPNLEDFSAPRLREEAILKDPRTWVCRKLYRLALEIVPSRGTSSQTMLLERIAGLICLETLDLKGRSWQSHESRLQALIFRLDCGLDRLRSLQNLITLDVGIKIQDWTEKDVEWILKNWPRLRTLKAFCHGDQQKKKILTERLRNGGVNVSGDTSVMINGLDAGNPGLTAPNCLE